MIIIIPYFLTTFKTEFKSRHNKYIILLCSHISHVTLLYYIIGKPLSAVTAVDRFMDMILYTDNNPPWIARPVLL